MKNKKLENQIREILDKGDKITLEWNCGGDEAIISVFINDSQINYDNEIAQALDMYIINFLELPDVGEFSMDGNGRILKENDKIYLECESILHGYQDYTNEGEELGWKDVNEKEDSYSGKREMFK